MDIEKHTGDNLGGNYRIKYAFVEDIAEIPEPHAGAIHSEVVMKAGTRWYEVYCTEASMQFKDAQEDSEHGASFVKELTGFVPKEREELNEALDALKNRRCVLDVIDNNNTRKLVGTISEPLYFSSSSDSKESTSGRNGTAISWKGPGTKKSPIYKI